MLGHELDVSLTSVLPPHAQHALGYQNRGYQVLFLKTIICLFRGLTHASVCKEGNVSRCLEIRCPDSKISARHFLFLSSDITSVTRAASPSVAACYEGERRVLSARCIVELLLWQVQSCPSVNFTRRGHASLYPIGGFHIWTNQLLRFLGSGHGWDGCRAINTVGDRLGSV